MNNTKSRIILAYSSPRRQEILKVIGSDTIVVIGGEILGKPLNHEEAFSMINML